MQCNSAYVNAVGFAKSCTLLICTHLITVLNVKTLTSLTNTRIIDYKCNGTNYMNRISPASAILMQSKQLA